MMPAHQNDVEVLAKDINTFAISLFTALRSSPENLVFSPFSLSAGLALAYGGAQGDTARQIALALHLSLDREHLHLAYEKLLEHFQDIHRSNEISLLLANSLWPQQYYPLLNSFKRLAREQYFSTILPIDYIRPEKARETINNWIADNTDEKICDLIPIGRLNTGVRIVMANAAYFSGNWELQFNLAHTHAELFYVNEKEHYAVPMMCQRRICPYLKTAVSQILELPFAGKHLSMLILLPNESQNISILEEQFKDDNLIAWFNSLHETLIELRLPRFEVGSSIQFCPALRALGIINAFDDRADFSGIDGYKWLMISSCLHKTLIKIHESGREAVAGLDESPSAGEPPTFLANRPFLFLIRDQLSGSILFMGRLSRP